MRDKSARYVVAGDACDDVERDAAAEADAEVTVERAGVDVAVEGVDVTGDGSAE